MSHGAISHQIALEQSLASFERVGQRVKLPTAPSSAGGADGLRRHRRRHARGTRPASAARSVSCVPAAAFVDDARLGSFTAQYPDIQLTLILQRPVIPRAAYRCLRIMAMAVGPIADAANGRASNCFQWSARPDQQPADPHVRDLADHVFLHGDDGREWSFAGDRRCTGSLARPPPLSGVCAHGDGGRGARWRGAGRSRDGKRAIGQAAGRHSACRCRRSMNLYRCRTKCGPRRSYRCSSTGCLPRRPGMICRADAPVAGRISRRSVRTQGHRGKDPERALILAAVLLSGQLESGGPGQSDAMRPVAIVGGRQRRR